MPESSGPIAQQAEALVRTAWLTATANIQWFTKISPDGSCLVPDFTHCTDEMMQAIESIDVEERESSSGEPITRRIRLKLKNSVRAMELLARAMGMDRREVKVGLSAEVNTGARMVEALKRKMLADDYSDNPCDITESENAITLNHLTTEKALPTQAQLNPAPERDPSGATCGKRTRSLQ